MSESSKSKGGKPIMFAGRFIEVLGHDGWE